MRVVVIAGHDFGDNGHDVDTSFTWATRKDLCASHGTFMIDRRSYHRLLSMSRLSQFAQRMVALEQYMIGQDTTIMEDG